MFFFFLIFYWIAGEREKKMNFKYKTYTFTKMIRPIHYEDDFKFDEQYPQQERRIWCHNMVVPTIIFVGGVIVITLFYLNYFH